jgi:hypothetical protein
MPTKPKPFHEGQQVVVTATYGPTSGRHGRIQTTEATVTKVGRTRVQVEIHGREWPFYMETGIEADGYGHRRVWVPEVLAQEARRLELVQQLDRLNVRVHTAKLTADQLEAILAIVEQD